MWTEAIYDLRLTEEQFYALTPRQFVWLRERHKQEREYQELLMAIPVSTLANHSMAAPKKAYKPYDFMPCKIAERAKKEAEKPKKRWTRKGTAEQLKTLRNTMPNHFIVRPPRKKRK